MVESKNCFLILSRRKNNYCESFVDSINNTIAIYDEEIPDKLLEEKKYCCLTETVKKNSSWDKSIYYIESLNLIEKYDYFYFIEDDVYSKNFQTFSFLFDILNTYNHDFISHDIVSFEKSLKWNWWKKYRKYKAKSYNPFCRLSKKMLELVMVFLKDNKKLIFHEVLFASLAYEHELQTLNLNEIDQYNNIFGTFQYRPLINIKDISDDKIYHPVKPKYETI
jgi:hypothetical protein